MIYSKCCFNVTEKKKACFILTQECNFKCSYCFAKCNNRSIKEFELEKTDIIIKILRDKGVEHVVLSGGEPLLYNEIYQLIHKLICEKFEISMCTNAFFATDIVCKKLYKSGLRKVTISLDEISRKNFEIITQIKNSYQSVVNGIKNFVRYNFHVTLNSVVYHTGFQYFNEIVSFAEILGVNEVCFTLPVCKNCDTKIFSENEVQEIYHFLELLSLNTKVIIEFNNPQCTLQNCPSENSIWGIDINGEIGECLVKRFLGDERK